MSYEHIWALVVLLTLATTAGLLVWARHLKEGKRLALREMIHRERMAALEKGVALPELPADPAPAGASDHLVRAARLGGLVLLFGGIGLTAALFFIPLDPALEDLHHMASMGLLPFFIGLGLLLYTWLDRGSRRAGRGDGAS
jgi:hypothetical protein